MLPAVVTHAAIQFHRLSPEAREDATAEAIASACVSYRHAAEMGKLSKVKPSTLADFAVRHVRAGRHVGGRQDAAKDVMSPKAQGRHGFITGSLTSDDLRAGGWRTIAVEDRRCSVADLACFRVDFARWLRTLTRRNRRILAALIAGHRQCAIARHFNLSPTWVCELRAKLRREWMVFQGEVEIPPAK